MALDLNTFDFYNKKVLLRTDFNVPLDESQQPRDLFRIQQSLPTIEKIISKGGTVIIASHMGRPEHMYQENFSLKHLVKSLELLTKREVLFLKDCVGTEVKQSVKQAPASSLILLENLRFYRQEEECELNFAKQLASLANVFINDAFSVSHRRHASIVSTPTFFDSENKGLGFSAQEELTSLETILDNPMRPFTALIGGSKVSTKLPTLENLIRRVDNLVVGGAMAFAFLKALGFEIGDSFYEPNTKGICLEVIKACKSSGVELILPCDIVAADRLTNFSYKNTYALNEIPEHCKGFDIGNKTIKLFSEVIKNSKSILWNGPMGVFENPAFAHGTRQMAQIIGTKTYNSYTLCGGGDTVAAINMLNIDKNFNHVSTAGGAMLDYLAGKELPGILHITKI